MKQFLKKIFYSILAIILIGCLLPNKVSSPIAKHDILKIDPESFWYYPWGEYGVHKGIDIFCLKNTKILSPISGFVISKGYGTISGNYIYIIGPKWHTYYFAHLDTIEVGLGSFVSRGDEIGRTGNTGNAANKPTHLHFSIQTILPYVWLYDNKDIEGWKKMFYLNPIKELHFDIAKDSIFKSNVLKSINKNFITF